MTDPAESTPSADPWHPYAEGRTIGERGSEEGVILRDEEHSEGARITLERDARRIPFAITCGLYGWLVHTCYFGTSQAAEQAFEEMKLALDQLVNMVPYKTDSEIEAKLARLYEAMPAFVDRFNT